MLPLIPKTPLETTLEKVVGHANSMCSPATEVTVSWSPGIEDGRLYSGVASNEQDGIGLLNTHECGVHDVVAAHICIQVREASLTVQVAAAHSVHQILQNIKPWYQSGGVTSSTAHNTRPPTCLVSSLSTPDSKNRLLFPGRSSVATNQNPM